jgi:hypothetical protein
MIAPKTAKFLFIIFFSGICSPFFSFIEKSRKCGQANPALLYERTT